MLNKRNHGTVYFGIRNDGSVFGQPIGAKTTTDIVNEAKWHLKPLINPRVTVLPEDDKTIIALEAYGNDTPYSAYGRYYKRSADQDLEMTSKELAKYFQNKDITYSAWENELTLFGAADIDEDLLISFVDTANEENRMNYRYVSVEDAMTRLGLMTDGRCNKAGYYLFAK